MRNSSVNKKPTFLKAASILLLSVSILALLICSFLVWRLFFWDMPSNTRTITVPDLRGSIYSEELLFEKRFFQVVRLERFSDEPIGTVLSQSPMPGSTRKASLGKHYITLTLYVSKGIDCGTVPRLIGLPASEGTAALLREGFSAKRIERNDTAPAGEIIAQSHDAGIPLKRGETVTFTVSRGSAVRKASVPSLSGLTLVRAKSLIQALGFRTGKIVYKQSGGEEGRVLAQSPLPDYTLPEGAKIDLTVSKKPPETTEPEETHFQEVPAESADTETKNPMHTDPPSSKESSEEDSYEQPPQGSSPEELIDRFLNQYFPNLRE